MDGGGVGVNPPAAHPLRSFPHLSTFYSLFVVSTVLYLADCVLRSRVSDPYSFDTDPDPSF